MFNGQMLFDRQMHVKVVCSTYSLYILGYAVIVEMILSDFSVAG